MDLVLSLWALEAVFFFFFLSSVLIVNPESVDFVRIKQSLWTCRSDFIGSFALVFVLAAQSVPRVVKSPGFMSVTHVLC